MKRIFLTILVLFLTSSSCLFAADDLPGVKLLLLSGGGGVPEGAVLSAGNRIWMDRNLGASRVAISPTDAEAYGYLFQWGRLADGHEDRHSAESGVQSPGDVPGHGYFITDNADWRATPNNSLWQEGSGTNNPCPSGFRLPTAAEWQIEKSSWVSNDAAGAFASPLKLVMGGYRYYLNGDLNYEGLNGHYWSSSIADDSNDVKARYLDFSNYNTTARIYSVNRAYGYSVRCIMD